jgi:hypothetical protein
VLQTIRLSANTSLMPKTEVKHKTEVKQLIWAKINLTELKNLN